MAFRADEEIHDGKESAKRYLLSNLTDLSDVEKAKSSVFLENLFEELGPIIDWYPEWHPLINTNKRKREVIVPHRDCGYEGLDHSVFFAHGFITCPYDDGQKVIDSVEELKSTGAFIKAERINVKLYNSSATPIKVTCHWYGDIHQDGTISLPTVMPLLLDKAIQYSKYSDFSESWETITPYLLGKPHGKRSSLFVNQETGQAIKKVWELLVKSGMFGPNR
ncbi:hypothetical protein GCM10023206_06610 [Acinetobacter puyangensis]|uniref:Uncharacterized protein n=1 Tax=Acinetobacter puyangensis TaxID=1096779 RepID=A0A240E8Q4_9GAMM|nr:hypothetical protein [Acinetobacter puyangensis]SNX44260.1 hypothetical protein SAMN05421731_102421 [Acinetobacter puyangensis]